MLSEKRIRDAKPETKTRILWDGTVKGLGVRITPAGAKSYILNYRVAGRERRATLARASEVSLAAVRKRAADELLRIRAGESDPLEREREARAAPTVDEGIDRFFDQVVPERLAIGKMKPKTVQEYRLQSKTIRDAIGRRRVEEVTRRDIERMVKPLRPVMRNRVLALASRLFTLVRVVGMVHREPRAVRREGEGGTARPYPDRIRDRRPGGYSRIGERIQSGRGGRDSDGDDDRPTYR